MKRVYFYFGFVVLLFFVFLSCGKKERSIDLTKQSAKTGYAIGYNFGKNLKNLEIEVSREAVLKGLEDALYRDKGYFTDEEISSILKDFQSALIKKNMEEMKKASVDNLKEEQEFLKKNAKRSGVITTDSGLQYEILRKGTGERPTLNDVVVVHYKGMFVDGKVFDSSYKRGEPAKFKLSRVIQGWQEGLQLMRVGAKYKFYIPSKLAYGERGAGGVIGPNKLLIFEVELLGIEKDNNK